MTRHRGHSTYRDPGPIALAPLEATAGVSDWQRMDEAIAEAKNAARQIGLNPDDSADRHSQNLADREGTGLTSFALLLDGLSSASAARDVENALRRIHGVRASIVLSTSIAWITAPIGTPPEVVIEKLAHMGVRAEMTQASLRRRAERLIGVPRQHAVKPRRLRMRERMQKRARAFMPDAQERHKADKPTLNTTDVLFTARELITKLRLFVSLVLSLPVLVLSYSPSLQFPYWQWVCCALATPVVTWCAWPFHRALMAGLRRKMSALDAASATGIMAAYVWSLLTLLITPARSPGWTSSPQWFAYHYPGVSNGELFLDVACGMTVLLLFGRIITRKSRSNLVEEARLEHERTMQQVTVVRKAGPSGEVLKQVVAVPELRLGDDILVPTGGVIPCDGQVVGGSSRVASGLLRAAVAAEADTGTVRVVKVNSKVFAGSTNLDGPLKVRVRHTGSSTRLAAMLRWIDESTAYQNRSAQIATRSASLLVPWVLIIAALNFLMWMLIKGNYNVAFATSLAIVAGVGPVALAISATLPTRYGIEAGARKGILIRNTETIQTMDHVDTVIFNRVGTLTKGAMSVETVIPAEGENPELVLRVAAALAMESDHPVSRALVKAAREARDKGTGGDDIPHWIDVAQASVDEYGTFTGLVEIPVDTGGGEMDVRQVDASLWRPSHESDLEGRLALAISMGGSPLVVNWKGRPRGVVILHSDPKDDAMEAIASLENMGIETYMLTRDAYPVARRFANFMGISKVLAGISPPRKSQTVRSVHTRGRTVGMVGDESVEEMLNVADVGLLVHPDDNFDVPAADVVVLRTDVSAIPQAFSLARKIGALVDRTIVFAWVYNALAVVLGAVGLLHPMGATVLMLASSAVTEIMAQRAKTY